MTPAMNWFVKTFKPWQMIILGLFSLAVSYLATHWWDGFIPGFISGVTFATGLSLFIIPIYLKFK
jgi:hypothetical protein